MTLYQQEMLRKLGRLDCAGRYDEEKGLLVISSGGTGLCCQDKKGYLSWESEKIRTEEEKAVLSQIGEQANPCVCGTIRKFTVHGDSRG